jgi:hypothetical protein
MKLSDRIKAIDIFSPETTSKPIKIKALLVRQKGVGTRKRQTHFFYKA